MVVTEHRRRATGDDPPRAPREQSQGIREGPVLQISGQLPFDPDTGDAVGTSVAEQTTQVLRDVTAALKAAGAGLDDVVMLRVYLTDVYMQLPPGLLVEIDALAVLDG
ncbi:Rid family hydrolase [Streptomyces sp. NPDC002172]